MTDLTLSVEQIRQFTEDGYLILENLLAPEDAERILRIARCDPQLAADAKGNQNYEGEGLDTRLAYRPRPCRRCVQRPSSQPATRRTARTVVRRPGALLLSIANAKRSSDRWVAIPPGLRLPLSAIFLSRVRQCHGRPRSGYSRQWLPESGARLQPPRPARTPVLWLPAHRRSPESCNGAAGNGGSTLRTGTGIGPILSRQHPARLSSQPQLAASLVAHLRVRGCLQYVRPTRLAR